MSRLRSAWFWYPLSGLNVKNPGSLAVCSLERGGAATGMKHASRDPLSTPRFRGVYSGKRSMLPFRGWHPSKTPKDARGKRVT